MAKTIRTAIALHDGVTGPLKSMHKAMSIVLNSFEAMQRASGNAIDTVSLQQARKSWPEPEPPRTTLKTASATTKRHSAASTSASGTGTRPGPVGQAQGHRHDRRRPGCPRQKLIGLSDELSTKARLNLLVDDGGSVDALEIEDRGLGPAKPVGSL
ncbi:MAG: hypothetical protein ACLUNZ_13865 [Evtepia sp.]